MADQVVQQIADQVVAMVTRPKRALKSVPKPKAAAAKPAKPAKTPKPKKERPGIQLVLRVPATTKATLKRLAHSREISMNALACEQLAKLK